MLNWFGLKKVLKGLLWVTCTLIQKPLQGGGGLDAVSAGTHASLWSNLTGFAHILSLLTQDPQQSQMNCAAKALKSHSWCRSFVMTSETSLGGLIVSARLFFFCLVKKLNCASKSLNTQYLNAPYYAKFTSAVSLACQITIQKVCSKNMQPWKLAHCDVTKRLWYMTDISPRLVKTQRCWFHSLGPPCFGSFQAWGGYNKASGLIGC